MDVSSLGDVVDLTLVASVAKGPSDLTIAQHASRVAEIADHVVPFLDRVSCSQPITDGQYQPGARQRL